MKHNLSHPLVGIPAGMAVYGLLEKGCTAKSKQLSESKEGKEGENEITCTKQF